MIHLQNVLEDAASWTCRCILFCTGWHLPSDKMLNDILQHETPVVYLIQNTSYWDFVLAVLYIGATKSTYRFRIILSSTVAHKFWFLSPLFFLYNCILSPSIREKNRGSSQVMIENLRQDKCKNPIVLIAPNGSTKGSIHSAWRTGWYYIAKGIGAKIGTIGINYHPLVRSIQAGTAPTMLVDPQTMTIENAEHFLRGGIAKIYPKFATESTVKLRVPRITCEFHDITFDSQASSQPNISLSYANVPEHATAAIDMVMFTSVLFILPVIACVLANQYDLFYFGFVSMYYSVLYHYSYEQDHKYKRFDAVSSVLTICLFVWRVLTLEHELLKWSTLSLLACTLHLYRCVTGREKMLYRSFNYTWFHSAFHVMASLTVMYFCYQLSDYT